MVRYCNCFGKWGNCNYYNLDIVGGGPIVVTSLHFLWFLVDLFDEGSAYLIVWGLRYGM